MSRAQHLVTTLRQGVGGSASGLRSAAKRHRFAGVRTGPAAAAAVMLPKDPERLAANLSALPLKKQVTVYERWPDPPVELPDGVTVGVRSQKERRRFVRPVDPDMHDWFETFDIGDVFYDIGANCGSLTLAAAGKHRENITIVAIEPGFANFESLTRNLSRNSMLGSVIPLQIALLDRTGLEPINYYRSTAAGTSLHAVGRPVDHEDKEFAPVETQMVLAYALDDLIETLGLPEPTHVKIDVDGTEGALLKGATRTLARGNVKDLLVEVVDHDRAGTRLSAIRELMAGVGYELAETHAHHAGDPRSFVADYVFRRSALR